MFIKKVRKEKLTQHEDIGSLQREISRLKADSKQLRDTIAFQRKMLEIHTHNEEQAQIRADLYKDDVEAFRNVTADLMKQIMKIRDELTTMAVWEIVSSEDLRKAAEELCHLGGDWTDEEHLYLAGYYRKDRGFDEVDEDFEDEPFRCA